MHEFSICQSIVTTVLDEYEKISPAPLKIEKVGIVAGRLHQIIPDSLTFAWEILTKETPAEGSRLEITFQKVECSCNKCGQTGEIEYPVFICRYCGSGDVEVTKGKELLIENMEVKNDE